MSFRCYSIPGTAIGRLELSVFRPTPSCPSLFLPAAVTAPDSCHEIHEIHEIYIDQFLSLKFIWAMRAKIGSKMQRFYRIFPF
jgi:hypothetical protein